MDQQELISTGVADIAQSLGINEAPKEEVSQDVPHETSEGVSAQPDEPEEVVASDEEVAAPVEEPAPTRQPPSSWKKDLHEHWSKIDPTVQEYIETREKQMLEGLAQYKEYHGIGKTMNEVIAPYKPMIQAAGLDEAKAVASLLNAHYRLTQGSPEQRMAVYQQLGRDLGLAASQQQTQYPPEIQQLMREQQQIKAALVQRQQSEFNALRDKTTREVESFAKDKPYFDEVASEVVAFINAGSSLEDAYGKAVYANPATRAKELQRVQKEAQEKLKAKAKAEVDAARNGTAANVRGRDTGKAPTEPKGRFLDEKSMKEDLRAIKARAH